jgi:polysaccharide biosynthesis/export protein
MLGLRINFGSGVMYKNKPWATAASWLLWILAGCAGGQERGSEPPAAASAGSGPPAAASAVDASSYLVGPGDSLQIFVWDHEDLTTTVQVRPDGKISTPLVEDLQAAGRSPTQLARDIEGVLEEFVRSPVVTVIVQSFVGETTQQIRVVGQAVEPRALQYRQGMTVLDVVIEVGGLSEFAAGNRARIVRRVNGTETEMRVRLDDLLNKGRMDQNMRMLPGDVLIIPQSRL